MKTFRQVLLGLLIVFALLAAIGFLLPGNVHIERHYVVHAPQSAVFEQVNTLKNWPRWSPWHQMDTAMLIDYSGPESGSGAAYTWQSDNNNVGSGKLEIMSSFPDDSLVMMMDFGENGKSSGKFVFTKTDTATLVVWSMDSHLGLNPVARWFGLLMKNLVGRDFEKGLANLAKVCEANQKNALNIQLIDLKPVVWLTMRDTASPATISQKLGKIFGNLAKLIDKRKLSPTGAPFAVYHAYSDTLFDLEAGFPLSQITYASKGVICSERLPGKAVIAEYFGPYEKSSTAYEAIFKYMKDNNLMSSGAPWEEYITDPVIEPDTMKWQTNIYFPVK